MSNESKHIIGEELIKEFISTIAESTNAVLSYNKGMIPKWEFDKALGKLFHRMLQVQMAGEDGLVKGQPGQADYVRGFSFTHYEDVIGDIRDAYAVGIKEESIELCEAMGQKITYVDFGDKSHTVRRLTEETLCQMCNDYARYSAMMFEHSESVKPT